MGRMSGRTAAIPCFQEPYRTAQVSVVGVVKVGAHPPSDPPCRFGTLAGLALGPQKCAVRTWQLP